MMPAYTMEPHNATGSIVGKKYCVKCGLIYLNNAFTQWAIKKGCNNEDHPEHANMRRTTGGNNER